jgi:hypothetical protein
MQAIRAAMNIPVRTIEISFVKQAPLADRNGRRIDAMRGGRGRYGDGSEAEFLPIYAYMCVCAYDLPTSPAA